MLTFLVFCSFKISRLKICKLQQHAWTDSVVTTQSFKKQNSSKIF